MHYDYRFLLICLVGALLIGNAVYGIAKKDLAPLVQGRRGGYFHATALLRESLLKIVFGLAFIAGGITLLIGSAHA